MLLLDLTPNQAAAQLPLAIIDLIAGSAVVESPNDTNADEGVAIGTPQEQFLVVTRADWFRIVEAVQFFQNNFLSTYIPLRTKIFLVKGWILANWPGAALGPATPEIINPNSWTGFTLIPTLSGFTISRSPFSTGIFIPILATGKVVRNTTSTAHSGTILTPFYGLGPITINDDSESFTGLMLQPPYVVGVFQHTPQQYSGFVLTPPIELIYNPPKQYAGIVMIPTFSMSSSLIPSTVHSGIVFIPPYLHAI